MFSVSPRVAGISQIHERTPLGDLASGDSYRLETAQVHVCLGMDVVIRRIGSGASRAQVGKVVVEIIRSLSVYAVMWKDQRSEMRVCVYVSCKQSTREEQASVCRTRT